MKQFSKKNKNNNNNNNKDIEINVYDEQFKELKNENNELTEDLELQENIEWKESWRDEYLKWICAFANTDGGKILIGKDDDGVVKGISNTENLLEVLPGKIKSHLGILVEVNHLEESGLKYLEIIVDKYPFPVSHKGRYFVRSGSTTQELKGNDLNKFLLEKVGKRWDFGRTAKR